jgi:hypothetical protein
MTNRERILAMIRGEVPDRVPWVPRLDFWYRAQAYLGTLPKELEGLTLMELADRLGVPTYGVLPDSAECPTGTEMLDRSLGIYQVPVVPYRVTLQDVERRVLKQGREIIVEYRTPVGSTRTTAIFTDEMLQAGASVPYVTEHPIREPRHFEVVGYIFSHLKVEPRMEEYVARRDQVGERGIVIGYASPSASPVHHIMKEFMPVDQFFYALHDCPRELARLAEAMEPYYEGVKRIAAESPAEVVLLGANYDDTITYPPFFAQHILPALRDYSEVLHKKGKYLVTHTDGENRKLLGLYLQAGFDIADSVCPSPMTSCTLEEIRAAFGERITIWGGIPSILLCASSASFEDCKRFIDGVLDRYRGQSHLILGVSDMVTADTDWPRFEYITEKAANTDWQAG